ncbi:hypothetical protein [Edaphobacter modestus]|nr:hypothetical protein [Edaphobacter modestus]
MMADYTKEPFLLIKVPVDKATPEDVGAAVTAALKLEVNPFFWYNDPPSGSNGNDIHALSSGSGPIPSGKGLTVIFKTEG